MRPLLPRLPQWFLKQVVIPVTAGPIDWPTTLTAAWDAHRHNVQPSPTKRLADGLLALVATLYSEDQALEPQARGYVAEALAADRPAWAAAGRAIWALGLWRAGYEDSALLQMILSEVALQDELRQPRPDAEGGPTGIAAAHNNLGVAYMSMRMFELAEPHCLKAVRNSRATYGPALQLQVCADLTNLVESATRWALYAEAVGQTNISSYQARRALNHVDDLFSMAAEIDEPIAKRYATGLAIGARSITEPASIGYEDRKTMAHLLSLPVFGDEPSELVLQSIAARVCRLAGDAEGCRDHADRAVGLHRVGDHASGLVAMREAALLEGENTLTWRFADGVTKDSEATRRRTVTAFRARLALAGLEQRVEQMSREHERLNLALQDALRQESELIQAATHDPLTGLPNRALFDQRLSQVLQADDPGTCCSVAFIDLDDFKAINDTAGHAAGDEVLRWVGQQLLKTATEADTVARLGGDEFGVLLVGRTHEQIRQWSDTAIEVLNTADRPHGATASIGVYRMTGEELTAQEVLHHADTLMYAAKREGGARGKLSTPD